MNYKISTKKGQQKGTRKSRVKQTKGVFWRRDQNSKRMTPAGTSCDIA